MRTFVGALRGDGTTAAGALAPTPGLADLPELLSSYRRNGLTMDAQLDDVARDVPTPLGLHVYRIVEEGLTNVVRHSGAERAWVRLTCEDGTLLLTIDANGTGLGAGGSRDGHGLIGVAERVALHGGESELGPGSHGGCRLAASLPLTAVSPDGDGSAQAAGDDRSAARTSAVGS